MENSKKRRKYYTPMVIVIAIMVLPVIGQSLSMAIWSNSSINNKTDTASDCCGTSCGGFVETYLDYLHIEIFKTTLVAHFSYYYLNGNFAHGYAGKYTVSRADWDVLGYVSLEKPSWASCGNNVHVYYGNGKYDISLWFFHSTDRHIYSTIKVCQNSYSGDGKTCGGYGVHNY